MYNMVIRVVEFWVLREEYQLWAHFCYYHYLITNRFIHASCPNFDSSPLHQFSKFNHFLWVKTGRVKSSQFYIQKIEWWKIRNHFFFTCILLDYVAYEVTKDFWKNIHFENKDLFIKHFMNKSLWQLVFFWGFKTHFVIEILIQGRKNCL